jgi:hypothetical protein
MGIWFNASPNAKQYCTLGGEDFVLEGDEVDIGSLFLCDVMSCGHRHEETDTQLLRATLSRDPGPPRFVFEAGPKSSKTEIVLKTLRAQFAPITCAALQRYPTIFVFTKLTVVADGDRP